MALEDTDLLVAYRPGEQKHYKIAIADFPTDKGDSGLPDGVDESSILVWDGSAWVVGKIDGGAKELSTGEFDFPDS